jgi:hypothetical protein
MVTGQHPENRVSLLRASVSLILIYHAISDIRVVIKDQTVQISKSEFLYFRKLPNLSLLRKLPNLWSSR